MARRLGLLATLAAGYLGLDASRDAPGTPDVALAFALRLCRDKGFDEDPPAALPQRASAAELRWQPVLDFDTDSCYNVPAIGPDGHVDRGRSRHEPNARGCRDEHDLDNSNVYSRARCNPNGWCAYVYDYFFEKDVGDRVCLGHQFDWEHIVVWTKNSTPRMAAASMHGRYCARLWDDIPKHDGTHVKAVYHKHALGTHCFRWSHGPATSRPRTTSARGGGRRSSRGAASPAASCAKSWPATTLARRAWPSPTRPSRRT